MTAKLKIFVLIFIFSQHSCQSSNSEPVAPPSYPANTAPDAPPSLRLGAERTDVYISLLQGRRLGLVVNQTSRIGTTHLVDSLLALGQQVTTVFAPEHGFRGDADAGEKVADGKDTRTGLPIISLYGSHKAPTAADLREVDVLIFDIQDVGARFYTYISTLHYVMQSAVDQGLPILVLDRPNPNGHYVDGPVLDPDYSSFVGMHPVPVVHGMTVGEYAQMINGEGWLANGAKADLTVITCENYDHTTAYNLPVAPSPNLPNMRSIYLYPSLCFFEGTAFSVGRGTDTQFQVYGHPDFPIGSYQFTPQSGPGAKYPKLEGETCYGVSLVMQSPEQLRTQGQLNLFYLLQAYKHYPNADSFFLSNHFIDKLAGSANLREQIRAGWNAEQIRASWQADLMAFKEVRSNYLLYPE